MSCRVLCGRRSLAGLMTSLALIGAACGDGAATATVASQTIGLSTATTATTSAPPTVAPTTSSATAAPSTGAPASATIPSTSVTGETAPAPTEAPTTTEPAPMEEPTTTAPPPVDLTAIDWANHSYPLPCPTAFPPTEVQLVDGEHRPPKGLGQILWDVICGEMGEPLRPVAVVTIACFGAGAFPASILVYDGSGQEPVLLGYAAWADSHKTSAFSPYHWEAHVVGLADGVLHLEGDGYGPDSFGCCPDRFVTSTVGLAADGTVVELTHDETLLPPPFDGIPAPS